MALKTKTPQEAKEAIRRQGKTIKQVSIEINCPYRAVHAVLSGVSRGNHGEAHRAAVALGIKEAA